MGDFLTAIWLCDVGNIALAPVEQQDEWLSGLLTGAPVRRAERVLRIAAPAARLESAAVTALLYYALAHPPLFAACDAVSFVRPQALRCAAKKTEDGRQGRMDSLSPTALPSAESGGSCPCRTAAVSPPPRFPNSRWGWMCSGCPAGPQSTRGVSGRASPIPAIPLPKGTTPLQ